MLTLPALRKITKDMPDDLYAKVDLVGKALIAAERDAAVLAFRISDLVADIPDRIRTGNNHRNNGMVAEMARLEDALTRRELLTQELSRLGITIPGPDPR
jgi:hypothetical protein